MDIKVLGPGCAKCQQTEKIVKEAVAEAGIAASVEKLTDVMKIAEYGVFGTPPNTACSALRPLWSTEKSRASGRSRPKKT